MSTFVLTDVTHDVWVESFSIDTPTIGLPAGFLALLLCVLNPDVLAHGHLATNDLPVVLFVFLSVIAFERLVERVTLAPGESTESSDTIV